MAASLANMLTEGVVPGRPVRPRHDVDHVVKLFRKLQARQLVVLGDPGAGKTVLTLLFTLGLLDSLLLGALRAPKVGPGSPGGYLPRGWT